jgi:hypothetical protein
MTTFTTKVDGWNKIKKKLQDAPKAIVNKVLKKSLKFGADRIAERARANCPVKTGKLRASIEVVAAGGGNMVGFDIGAGDRGKGGAWYAHLIENGYLMAARAKGTRRERGDMKGKTRKIRQVPGKYYLTRALEAEAEPILNEVMNDLVEVFSE